VSKAARQSATSKHGVLVHRGGGWLSAADRVKLSKLTLHRLYGNTYELQLLLPSAQFASPCTADKHAVYAEASCFRKRSLLNGDILLLDCM
jgi:hypothetical protein